MNYRHYLFGVFFAFLFCGTAQASDFVAKIFAPYPLETESANPFRQLQQQDRVHYQRIFALQRRAQWSRADSLIKKINNPILMGHVRFQRLMHPRGYRSTFSELANWLVKYADLPEADRVYRLAQNRRPAETRRKLKRPVPKVRLSQPSVQPAATNAKPRDDISWESQKILNQVEEAIKDERISVTLRRLRQHPWRSQLSDREFVQALGKIAKGYAVYGHDIKAIAAAQEALKLNTDYPSQAYWWAGLAAWRMGNYKEAAKFFIILGSNPDAKKDMAAAANFWGWRAAMRLGQIHKAHSALKQASKDRYSFYGQLAGHALSIPDQFDWNIRTDVPAAKELVQRHPVLQRILALAEVNEHGLAQAEFAQIRFDTHQDNLLDVMLIADQAGLADAVISLGNKERKKSGIWHDSSRYPLPRWGFMKSYSIDRALLFGLIRQESLFEIQAKSNASARGLMQIMPDTARLMQKRLNAPLGSYYNPAINLTLGQEYLQYLLRLPEINYNLIYALAGYNAGPGRLRDWRKKPELQNDPLLFIETIPMRETRHYIETVLGNLWIYRKRLGQPTPSLEMILESQWPTYQRFDTKPTSKNP